MGAHQSSRHPRRRFNRSSQDDEEIRLINEDMVRDEDGRMRVQVPPSMEYEWNSYGARTSQFLCFTGRRKMENVVHSLLVRQITGHSSSRSVPHTERLKAMGGNAMYSALDKASSGMVSDCVKLNIAIQKQDLTRIALLVAQIAPRLIADPNAQDGNPAEPLNTSRKVHIERESFVFAGGIDYFKQVFRDPFIVGSKAVELNDARKYDTKNITRPIINCWNEILISMRDIVYSMPDIIGNILENKFLPFLFTLLDQNECFDGAAALIVEVLSIQSQKFTNASFKQSSHSSTFCLSEVPRIFELWQGFTCRQLAYFCRILALLTFEPEDRQFLESSDILKSLELLQVRRDRASRVGSNVAVDSNMAICLGDEVLIKRLVQLIRVMNFGPEIDRAAPYHMMSHFPWIPDTLLMLGLVELENWDDIEMLDHLTRSNIHKSSRGVISTLLESLVDPLMRNQSGSMTHIGHIIHVINAAQRVGISSQNRSNSNDSTQGESALRRRQEQGTTVRNIDNNNVYNDSYEGVGISEVTLLANQMMFQRLQLESEIGNGILSDRRVSVTSSQEAANELQFNALLLAPYQVEVLFVLCTLLSGRRKVDAQNLLAKFGLVQALNDMFFRLSWGSSSSQNSFIQRNGGIHGPGCECNPESAIRVQYLRLLHNFCDRDHDNYDGRRLLLSLSERQYIFCPNDRYLVQDYKSGNLKRPKDIGLLSNIVDAFMKEEEDSPYKFWLSSCIEAFLRGSSENEQIFTAYSGLLHHLINDILSDGIHCAGSLQTSFDLLGELCKGNLQVLESILEDLDEPSFRRLMSIAANNLVDSNVFIRGLIFCIEREKNSSELTQLIKRTGRLTSLNDVGYLSHSWIDTNSNNDQGVNQLIPHEKCIAELIHDTNRRPEWFVPNTIEASQARGVSLDSQIPEYLKNNLVSVGDHGWVFTDDESPEKQVSPDLRKFNPYVWKISCFLAANGARILRDLLANVDLHNINHENICCLNTAIVLTIFSSRHNRLENLLEEVRKLDEHHGEKISEGESDVFGKDSVLDAMKSLRFSFSTDGEIIAKDHEFNGNENRGNVLNNFRQLLWFWREYYRNRGRDRLSLEFSSHIRFTEWKSVVSKLCADNGSKTALSHHLVRVPRSPYKRPPRCRK